MSLYNDIAAITGARTALGGSGQPGALVAGQQPGAIVAGQQPGGASAGQSVTDRFGNVFSSTFAKTMSTVFQRGAAGEFDDRTLALEEQAALQRLRVAQQAASVQPVGTDGVPEIPADVGGDGADAAPDAGGVPAGGGVTGGGATTAMVAVAEQRQLYAVRVRQSEARLSNISVSLQRDFPLASQLVSASTGSWDPATFVPQTKEQAEAFAHRLVIDATEAAARLEIVKTQLDAAKFELTQGGGADVQQLVADLEASYDRQKSYVDKLAGIVDKQSGGQISDAGADALAGDTMRTAEDIPVEEIAADLRQAGLSEEQVERIVGAGEMAVEQEKTPGGSVRLKSAAAEMTSRLVADFNKRMQESIDRERERETERVEQQRIDDKHAEKKQAGIQQAEQAHAKRDAEFQNWIATLAAQSAARRDAG